jgi:hypothetical protein
MERKTLAAILLALLLVLLCGFTAYKLTDK